MGGRQSGEYSALNDGTREGPSGAGVRGVQQAYRDAIRQIENLRASGAAGDESQAELESLLARMKALDPSRFPGNPELLDTLRRRILPEIEQLEIRLRRQAGDSGKEIRNAGPSRVPTGYEKAVADYYRRLSKGN
jgi:hypothetical protein